MAKAARTAATIAPSQHAGMGATIYDSGVGFRVWAPHAEQISVVGSFNEWHGEANLMYREDDGYWSADVLGAKAGDTYKYRIISGGNELFKIDPYAREVTSSVGEGVIHDPSFAWDDDEYRTPPWNEMVIYELHIGTFSPSQSGRGTFDSATERLGYLRDLGINTVQVMPPMEFAGGISWGYNPSHSYAIESDYGGPTAFKCFVKAAHQHGIAIILDVVYNHFGPSDLDLWAFDGWSENGKGGIYFYNDHRSATPWGDTRPDYGRAEVRQYLRDNALMWIEDYHVDGLRWDATAMIRNITGDGDPAQDIPEGWALIQWINDEIDARQPWKVTIAEDLRNNDAITTDTAGGGAGFDAQWDAAFVHPMRAAIAAPDDVARDMNAVAAAIMDMPNGEIFSRVIYTESHDEVANGKARVPEEISPADADSWWAKKRSTLGGSLVLTAPGIPMIFQGQEMLSYGHFDDNQMMDWHRAEQFGGITQLYSTLVKLRANSGDVTRGLRGDKAAIIHVNNEAKVIAFHRWQEGGPRDSVVVVANFSQRGYESYRIGLPAVGLWKVRFNSDWNGYDAEFGNFFTYDTEAEEQPLGEMPLSGNIGIGPYSAIVLSQD